MQFGVPIFGQIKKDATDKFQKSMANLHASIAFLDGFPIPSKTCQIVVLLMFSFINDGVFQKRVVNRLY